MYGKLVIQGIFQTGFRHKALKAQYLQVILFVVLIF